MVDNTSVLVEISEGYPNPGSPRSCAFVKAHVESMKKGIDVIIFVPLRMVPPRRIFVDHPLRAMKNLFEWIRIQRGFLRSGEEDCVVYLRFISLLRPWFEILNVSIYPLMLERRILNRLKGLNVSAVYCHWALSYVLLAKRVAKKMNVPLIVDVHEEPDNATSHFPFTKKRYRKNLIAADLLIVHSENNAEKLKSLGVDPTKIRKVFLGIDEEFYRGSIEEVGKNVADSSLSILTVAGLENPVKRIELLIRGVDQVSQRGTRVMLTIVGDGSLRRELEALVYSLGLSSGIRFTGMLLPPKIRELLQETDLFIMPSVRDSFGLVFVEALASGVPVAGTRGAGAIQELERLGFEPFVLQPDDLEGIISLMGKPRSELLKVRERIISQREKLHDLFSWEKHGENIHAIITELCAGSHGE